MPSSNSRHIGTHKNSMPYRSSDGVMTKAKTAIKNQMMRRWSRYESTTSGKLHLNQFIGLGLLVFRAQRRRWRQHAHVDAELEEQAHRHPQEQHAVRVDRRRDD